MWLPNMLKNIIIILFLLALTLQASSGLAVSPNRKYFLTGIVQVDTASTYNTTADSWNTRTHQVTYVTTFGSGSVGGAFLSIHSINVKYKNNRISFYGTYSDVGATSFKLNVHSNISSSIQLLIYRYLIFSSSIVERAYFDSSFVIQSVQKNITKSSPHYFPVYPYSGFSIVGGIDGTISFIGFDVNVTSVSNITDLSVFPVSIQANSVFVSVQSNSTSPVYVSTIHFSWVLFNKQHYNKDGFASFTSIYIQGSSVSYTNSSQLYSQTTTVGVYSVHFQSDSFISYSIDLISPNYVSVNTSNVNPYFKSMVVQFFTYYCNYSTPYLDSSANVCYDVCPVGTSTDDSSLSCMSQTQSKTKKTIIIVVIIVCSVLGLFLIIGTVLLIAYCLRKQQSEQIYIRPQNIDPPQQNVGLSLIIKPSDQYKEKDKSFSNPTNLTNNNSLIRNPYLPESEDLILPPYELAVWKVMSDQLSVKQTCTICLFQQVYFKTYCGHYFHIKCIIQWGSKHNDCPNCRVAGIMSKKHQVFCRICRKSQRQMSFGGLKAKYLANSIEEDIICASCKVIPI